MNVLLNEAAVAAGGVFGVQNCGVVKDPASPKTDGTMSKKKIRTQ